MKFENTSVFNFEGALRGMRNPMSSWDKGDSGDEYEEHYGYSICEYVIGQNDLALAQSLIKAGSEHRKFMRQIFVSVDITAPLYWWKELIRLLPESWLQKRTVTMDYENLLAICSKGQRRFHKLTEWSKAFINWTRTLPYAQELIFLDELEDKKNG